MPRTNNNVEGWHNALRVFIGQNHPNIYKFIANIRDEQGIQEMRMAQTSSQQLPPVKKYRKYEEKMLKIVQEYDRENVVEYLTRIAHNVAF